jgi:hypothetical protein
MDELDSTKESHFWTWMPGSLAAVYPLYKVVHNMNGRCTYYTTQHELVCVACKWVVGGDGRLAVRLEDRRPFQVPGLARGVQG